MFVRPVNPIFFFFNITKTNFMNQQLLLSAKEINNKYKSGDITAQQYFVRLASLGKKYNISVWQIQKVLAAEFQLAI